MIYLIESWNRSNGIYALTRLDLPELSRKARNFLRRGYHVLRCIQLFRGRFPEGTNQGKSRKIVQVNLYFLKSEQNCQNLDKAKSLTLSFRNRYSRERTWLHLDKDKDEFLNVDK